MFCQKRDILLAAVQLRYKDREDVQTIVQVFAESAFLHKLLEIAAGSSKESHIRMQLPVAPYSGERAFLKKP